MMRIAKLVPGVALLGSLVCSGVSAVGAAAPKGGAIQLYVTPNLAGNGSTGTVVITGAIGDFGTYVATDKNGKPDPNGHDNKITLKKGTFVIDSTTLDAAANKKQPTFNMATCSGYLTVSGPVTLMGGTRLYTGIAGTVKVTELLAFILPTYTSGAKKGQCNTSNNAMPLATYGSITGAGMVSFS